MSDSDIDVLFRRFQETGDPAAIAAVYDRIAPELLLLASHLGSRAADAEDLLQATFVAAIESCEEFDPRRRVMPWLVGILVNHARREWRDRSRRLDPFQVEPADDLGPLRHAESAELARRLSEQLAALPEHYRQVLTLRFTYGLMPREIGHALGLSPETVKTRLRRGRDVLRRALPAGFTASLAFLTTPKSLASVREAVVDHAQRRAALRDATPASAPAGPGVWSGSAHAWMASVAVVIAVATLVSTFAFLQRPSPQHEPIAAASAAGEGPRATPRATGAPSRRDASSPLHSAGDLDRARAVVTVRHHDDQAGAGVWVRIEREAAPDPSLAERWVRADDAGVLEVSDLTSGRWRFVADRGGETTLDLRDGSSVATTLTIPRGVDLHGRVTDDGEPVADAGIWLSREDAMDEGWMVALTAPDGTFALRSVAPGRCFAVRGPSHSVWPLQAVRGAPGDVVDHHVDLTELRTDVVLRGQVLDEHGVGLEGITVQVGDRLPWLDLGRDAVTRIERSPPVMLATDAEGRFEVRGPPLFYNRVPVYARATGYALATGTVVFSSLVEDLTISLVRGLELTGRARDAAGGAVAAARISGRDPRVTDYNKAPRFAENVAWSDPDGVFRLSGLPPGPISVTASADGPRRVSTEIDPRTTPRWDATFTPLQPVYGWVVDDQGRPLEGLQVRAVPPRGHRESRPSLTAASGEFRVEHCEDLDHGLWVTAPSWSWRGVLFAQADVRPNAGPLRVVVPSPLARPGTVVGRLVDAAGSAVAGRVSLRGARPGYAAGRAGRDGFRLEGLPPLIGGYALVAESDDGRMVARGQVTPRAGDILDLGDLTVTPTGAIVVRLRDASGDPLDGFALVELDEAPFLGVRVVDGEALIDGLVPARYRVHLVDEVLAQVVETVDVVAGQSASVDWVGEIGAPVELALEHPRPRHFGARISWYDERGLRCVDPVVSDSANRPTFRQALCAGTYRVVVECDDGARGSVSLTVPAGAASDASPPEATPVFLRDS